uniref:Uncharacterized protein n=1 Tax=Arundo donax TaxID=35708 RepID=A0A0A9EMD5_ARUDO
MNVPRNVKCSHNSSNTSNYPQCHHIHCHANSMHVTTKLSSIHETTILDKTRNHRIPSNRALHRNFIEQLNSITHIATFCIHVDKSNFHKPVNTQARLDHQSMQHEPELQNTRPGTGIQHRRDNKPVWLHLIRG